MNRQTALQRLRDNAPALQARGVLHAALFGSVARGEEQANSDVDILLDFDPAARVTIFDYVAVKDQIARIFEVPVDVIDREALKPHLRQPAARDVVYAF